MGVIINCSHSLAVDSSIHWQYALCKVVSVCSWGTTLNKELQLFRASRCRRFCKCYSTKLHCFNKAYTAFYCFIFPHSSSGYTHFNYCIKNMFAQ